MDISRLPMLQGDSVNIRVGECRGWLLRFPGCHPHLSRWAGVSFVSLLDHSAVKCDDPQLSVHRTFSSNNVRITIFQEIMLFSLLVFVVFCAYEQNRQLLLVLLFYFFCVCRVAQSVVSGYGLDDRTIQVRSPAEAKGFFVQPLCPDRLWGPPSLLYNGYRGSYPWR
jgi:hypothetical protein